MLLNSKTLFEAETLTHTMLDMESLRPADIHAFTTTADAAPENKPHHFIDFLLAIVAIAFLSPVFIIVAALIKLHDGGSIIFKHRRVGQNGKMFEWAAAFVL